jgi:ABC-type spermidine/putrescine transport system permease subunit I
MAGIEDTAGDTESRFLPEDGLSLNAVNLLTGPTVAWFVIFLLLPVALIVVYSFLTYSSFNVLWEFTLKSWQNVFSETVLGVFGRTLLVGLVVTFVTLLFGYPLAYYLRFHMSLFGGILLLLFVVIPFWTNGLIRVIGWIPVLGRTGAVNQTLIAIGLIDQPLAWLLFSPFSQSSRNRFLPFSTPPRLTGSPSPLSSSYPSHPYPFFSPP